jgi:hypothetical protein
MPATRERISISADGSQGSVLAFSCESVLDLTNTQLPDAFNAFLITSIIYAGPRLVIPLRGEDYPALVRVWDNDVDAIYDSI